METLQLLPVVWYNGGNGRVMGMAKEKEGQEMKT
jgi:hypothetical protein